VGSAVPLSGTRVHRIRENYSKVIGSEQGELLVTTVHYYAQGESLRREAMKLRFSSAAAGFVFTVVVGVVPVSGQQRTSWFSNPFTISSGVDAIPMPDGGVSVQPVTLVAPSRFAIDGASPRTHWGFGYQPEFDLRFGTGQLNSWNHSADANFGHLFTRRTKLEFGHSFVKSTDPSRIFTDSIFVMPHDNFRENASALVLSHESSFRSTLTIRLDNTITKLHDAGDTGLAALNQYGVAGTAGISRRLGQRQKLTLSYSLIRFTPYRFDSEVSAARFAGNIPIIAAGIARYASTLALSVSRSSASPTGLAGNEPGVSPAPRPSSLPPGTVPSGGTATVGVSPSISGPIISASPAVPLVGVVTPLLTTPSIPTESCELLNNACSTTAIVAAPSGGTSIFEAGSTGNNAAAAGSEGELFTPQYLTNPFHVASASYTFLVNPGLFIEMSGGAMRDREMSYLMSMQVERRLDRVWFAGGFQRFLSYFGTLPFQGSAPPPGIISLPNGIRGRSVFSDVTGRVGGKINRRTQLEMSLSLSRSAANFVTHDLETAIARARISYWINDRVTIFADADSFYENVSYVAASRTIRQRFFGGLQVRFSDAASRTRGTAQMAQN